MSPVRVVVVDDHIVFREGLRALLARVEKIEVVGEASTTNEAVTVVASVQPDVVLMDLHLPGDGGVAATKQITAIEAAPAVLVLTMYSDDSHLQSALQAGARGYLLKDADPDAIVRAVLAVHAGQVIFDQGIASQVIASTSKPRSERPFPSLTDRELEILDKMSRGLRNEAIATRTGLSIKTVQNNVSTILLKLGASDRAHAVAIARDAGLGRST
jgi:DNA-binding NarL/FixJ family response regulator